MCGLTELGWDAAFESEFLQEWRDAGYVPARVIREDLHIYHLAYGEEEATAQITGRFRYETTGKGDFPAVGDWVAAEQLPQAEHDSIHAVLPRRTAFSRHSVTGRTDEQIVAANISTVFLVSGLDGDFNPRRIERYIATARASHAAAVIILNKADLCPDVEDRVMDVRSVAQEVPVHAISAKDRIGLQDLQEYMQPGKTIAVMGMSGVGKSTLINAILGEDRLATSNVRDGDNRGRHTTTHRELVLIPDGPVFIDTPGLRRLSMWGEDDVSVSGFEDIEELTTHCRFSDCAHASEPDCAVREAIEAGQLDATRLRSYRNIQSEFASSAQRQDDKERKREQRALREQRNKDIALERRRINRRRRRD